MIRFAVGIISWCAAIWVGLITLALLTLLAAVTSPAWMTVVRNAADYLNRPVIRTEVKKPVIPTSTAKQVMLDDSEAKRELLKAGAAIRELERLGEFGTRYPEDAIQQQLRAKYIQAREAYVLAVMKLQGLRRSKEMIDKLTEDNFVVRPGVIWDYQERAEVREYFMSKVARSQ